jgi:hypothetical protein
MELRHVIEEALRYPGASSAQAEQHASALSRAVEIVVDALRPWAPLRAGHCVFCGEAVDSFDGAELRLSWVTARLTRDGRKQGGRNNPGRAEVPLGIWMHRGCSDRYQRGLHRDQRTFIIDRRPE